MLVIFTRKKAIGVVKPRTRVQESMPNYKTIIFDYLNKSSKKCFLAK